MPPKRKSATRSASQQSTLTFNGKANRVTKPSQQRQNAKSAGAKTKKDPALDEDVVRTELNASAEPDIEAPTTADVAIQDEAEKALGEPGVRVEDVLGGRAAQDETGATGGAAGVGWVDDEEERARKVSEAQVKKYWKKKEEARIVPRVHQEGLSLEEKVLREWDMSGQYGVSVLPDDVVEEWRCADDDYSPVLVSLDLSVGSVRMCWVWSRRLRFWLCCLRRWTRVRLERRCRERTWTS